MKSEKELRAELVVMLRWLRGAVVLRHEDIRIAGIPDISVTWNGWTTWLECKVAHPHAQSRGIQHITATRLHNAGRCYYIVWQRNKLGEERTYIATPQELIELDKIPDERVTSGYNHKFVVDFIRRTHNDNNGT